MEERKSNQRSDTEKGDTEREREERGGKKTSRSLEERQREVIQIERRCLIWHSVPLRHLISFNSCGGESRVAEGMRGVGLPRWGNHKSPTNGY